jgi:hypothetical protein
MSFKISGWWDTKEEGGDRHAKQRDLSWVQ